MSQNLKKKSELKVQVSKQIIESKIKIKSQKKKCKFNIKKKQAETEKAEVRKQKHD